VKSAKMLFNLKNPIHFMALGLGSGLCPKIPGTAGTLMAIPFFLLLAQLPFWAYTLVVILAFLLGIKICGIASKDAGVHDHGAIVWDEFVGYWVTMLPLVFYHLPITWQAILFGFLFLRVFDMLKPFPISYLDKNISGGLGIMIDDVAAAIAAMICLRGYLIMFV